MTWLLVGAAVFVVAFVFVLIFWDIARLLADLPAQVAYDVRVSRRRAEVAANEAWSSGRDEAFGAAVACTLRRAGLVTAVQVADAIADRSRLEVVA